MVSSDSSFPFSLRRPAKFQSPPARPHARTDFFARSARAASSLGPGCTHPTQSEFFTPHLLNLLRLALGQVATYADARQRLSEATGVPAANLVLADIYSSRFYRPSSLSLLLVCP
jgi:hypothetical protein